MVKGGSRFLREVGKGRGGEKGVSQERRRVIP